MAYVAPSTVVAGQTYGAAAHNIIVNDIIDHEDRLDTVQNAQYPARNVLVNGAMQFAQRGTSVSGIANTSGYYTADRWLIDGASSGTWTQALSADTPTGSGFRNSVRMTCSATAASAAGTYQQFQQRLEGQTLQHIKKGTASAQQLTLSFWVKANRTGTYIAELRDADNTRFVSGSYTVSAADTWEQKTITFPADTTGALDNDNALSLTLNFWLAAGTTYSSGSLGTTWASVTDANRAVGQTKVGTAANDYWAVTGVQLEPGSQASPFEFVRYDDELRRCQRYFYRINADQVYSAFGVGYMSDATNAQVLIPLPTRTRSVPSSLSFSAVGDFVISTSSAGGLVNSVDFRGGGSGNANTTTAASVSFGTATSLTAGTGVTVLSNNRTTTWLGLSAEL